MTEYRIVTKIDPSGVTQGRAKVSQELKGIQTEAAATGAAINRAFDQSQFDRSIGNLISRLDTLDKNMTEVASTSAAVAASNTKVVSSLDQLTGATTRSANATSASAKESTRAAASQSTLEAATRRVLQAVDQEAAEVMRLNALLADAKRALDAGKISQEQYAAVQKMASAAGRQQHQVTAMQRMGMQQLGFQLGDIATMYNLGAKPAQIFASQIGQVTQAVQMMSGGTSAFAKFIGGPWGIALSVGLIMLTPFIAKLFEGNDALGQAVKKMQQDAKETELNRQAKELFNKTLEGQIALQRDLNKELEQNLKTQQQIDRGNLARSYGSREGFYQERNTAAGQLATAQADARAKRAAADAGGGIEGERETTAALRQAAVAAEARVAALQARIKTIDANIAIAERSVRAAEIPIERRAIENSLDASTAEVNRNKKAVGELDAARVAGKISREKYRADLKAEEELHKRNTEALARQKREERQTDGVSRFKSQAQAVGIAGRELQSYGLRVSENEQFGGINGGHKSSHKNAIDVNQGTGVVEANVPDLRKQFDGLARRYQARGYRVLWNGWVYEANGSGPTRRIPAGQDQHRDHMHVEAPGTIVGKATNASTEDQAGRDEKAAATAAEQQRDFVSNVVDQAAARGMPQGAETVAAQVAKQQADYKRRFNADMSPDDVKKVTGALTAAEAREQSLHFDEAYVKPLERLKVLQGKTGLDRQVLNAQLAESARIGKELTQPQKDQIENSIRQGDALQREAEILASIHGPIEDYQAQIKALSNLLAAGSINQDTFNRRVSELDLSTKNREQGQRLGGGGEAGARLEQMKRDADAERELAQVLRDARIIDEQEQSRRLIEIERQYQAAKRDLALSSTEQLFGSLADIAEAGFGKQSAIYKAAFVAEKAIAIARSIMAIQTGIAQAMSLPFPGNLVAAATVAAQAVSIVANIKSVTLALANGGYVSGPGGAREDKIPARLSNGEFVVNADATSRNRALLEAINNGTLTAHSRQATASAATAGAASVGGESWQLNFGDINVQTGPGTTGADGRVIGREVKAAMVSIARKEIADAKRSGGALTKTKPSVMSG